MQSMTAKQAALLMIVAAILKDQMTDEVGKSTLAAAIEDVAFELTALGITAPAVAQPAN